jgi:dienelactone hydrolase
MGLEPIVYRIAERSFHGYVADGSQGRRVPGVLVGHDGAALNAHTKERAAMLAQHGYVALAMDLYGAVEPPLEEAKAFMAEMTDAGVDWQMILYGGTGHSFTNRWVDAMNILGFAYAPAADERSWRKMQHFLAETLGGSADWE